MSVLKVENAVLEEQQVLQDGAVLASSCAGVQSINKTPEWAVNTTQAIEDASTQKAAGVLCSVANTSSLLPCFSRFCIGICYWL